MTDLQKEQIKKFRIQGLGYGAIAKQMGLSTDTVKSHCGKTFDVYGNAGRKYCCHECYIADRFGEW